MTTFKAVLVLAVAGAASASYRFDPNRTLISIDLGMDALLELEPATQIFERADFEAVRERNIEIWATDSHLKHLRLSKVAFRSTPDIGAATFADEMNRTARYTDPVGAEPNWAEYCGYDCMVGRLAEMAANGGCEFPFELENIGQSVNGRDIWVAKIGVRGPSVFMGGNIHGDETTGGQLLQRWLWETCNQPSKEQIEVAGTTITYYMPMLNPDGYEANRRGNGNNADLNRDFPTVTGGSGGIQPESQAYMKFHDNHVIDVSLMFHGGAVVVNYAYDSCYTSNIVPRPCPPASTSMHRRDADVIPSSAAYADAIVAEGVRCTVGSNCIVNGAAWYQITGSLQDWEFHFKEVVGMTMEVTSTKRPAGSTLPATYNQNKNAIYKFIVWPSAKHTSPRTKTN